MLRSAAVAMRRSLVTTERLGAVARITMNRPEVRNAQDSALILAPDDAMRAAADERVRVVILAGAGPSFSSGHDLKPVVGEAEEDAWRKLRATPKGRLRHERELCVEKCLAIYHLPKPTVAQVQGHCVAAGLMLAAMCDLIVASDDAVFSNPVLRMTGAGVELLIEPWELLATAPERRVPCGFTSHLRGAGPARALAAPCQRPVL